VHEAPLSHNLAKLHRGTMRKWTKVRFASPCW